MSGRHDETWVDRQIREATERGEFSDLPGAGKPLRSLDGPYDENWWLKGLIERERIDTSALLPPQLAMRKEAEALPAAILAERSEGAVRALLEDFNDRVRELWRRPVQGPPVVVRTVDVEALVERWRSHREAEAARAAAAASAVEPQPAGRRWAWLSRLLKRPG
jgi:hypothetical protein